MEVSVEKAVLDFKGVIDHVISENEPAIIVGPEGRLVRIVPIPKPISYYKGHPVYRPEDLQYLGIPPYE